jgi:hypothetical protein
MCCSLHPANFSETLLYAAETELKGTLVHVLGYQNQAENLTTGPNAMLLPIPAKTPMGHGNAVDMRAAKNVLKDYQTAITPRTRSMSFSKGMRSDYDSLDEVQVFDHGSYTIALSQDASAIPGALDRVPVEKRPPGNQAIFDAYAKLYPDWSFALCCWDGSVKAEPMLWWYEPKDTDSLFLPTLDAHDGRPPKVGHRVDVDHTVLVGSLLRPSGYNVWFTDFHGEKVTNDLLAPFLATRIVGKQIDQTMPNGDFRYPLDKLKTGQGGSVVRVPPPGA